jgi:acyl-CoA thioesterase FadM
MHQFTVEMSHRPERNGTIAKTTHAPFYLPLEVAMYGWFSVLGQPGNEALSPSNFAAVNVQADYAREMHTAETIFELSLERIGESSVTLAFEVSQAGAHAAAIRVVLVRVDPDRLVSVAFSAAERGVLERIQQTDSAVRGELGPAPTPSP